MSFIPNRLSYSSPIRYLCLSFCTSSYPKLNLIGFFFSVSTITFEYPCFSPGTILSFAFTDSTLFTLSIWLIFKTLFFSFVKAKNSFLLSFEVSSSITISSILPSRATNFTIPSLIFWLGSRKIFVVIYPFLTYSSFNFFTNSFKSEISSSLFS